MKNEGKIFEDCIAASCPDHVLVKRLNDNASAWSGGEQTRFASKNECDFIMFNDKTGTFYGLELKSTGQNGFTFWREDFEKSKTNILIKKHQILGLQKWSKHKGQFGLILNFRKNNNRTFFVPINNFLEYTNKLIKKSVNLEDVLCMDPIEISNKKIRTNYRYDMDEFFNTTALC